MTQLKNAPRETTTVKPSGGNSNQTGSDDHALPPVDDSPSVSGTIAAVTVAVLACVLLLTLVMICRALRKRRRARQGERMGDIPTVSTGIMGTGVAAYSNVRVDGSITWEPINSNHPTSSAAASSSTNQTRCQTSHNNHRPRHSRSSHTHRS